MSVKCYKKMQVKKKKLKMGFYFKIEFTLNSVWYQMYN